MLMQSLKLLAQQGSLRQLDYQFALFIARQAEQGVNEQNHEALAFVAALVSHELGKGNICLDCPLDPQHWTSLLGMYGKHASELQQALQVIDWPALLHDSHLVACIDGLSGEKSKIKPVPLVFDGQRLYLYRYWFYEQALANKLHKLAQPQLFSSQQQGLMQTCLQQLFARQYGFLFAALKKLAESNQVQRQQLVCDHLDVVLDDELDWSAIDDVLLRAKTVQDLQALDQLVPDGGCINWQKVAAAVALTRQFSVISGGPGTGKTTTVAKLLASLVQQGLALSQQRSPTIKLVAPTGKAAARLTESIGLAIAQLPIEPQVKALIPTEASTIHRLLGAMHHRAEFRHNADNLLHVDILVVDEASMVDLSMMYKLLSALPDQARLILLGDKDQLSSVEAGSVLGDICSFNQQGYSREQYQALAHLTGFSCLTQQQASQMVAVSPLADSLCVLQKSYRFDARSGIGQLAKAINSGQAQAVQQVLQQGFNDIEYLSLSAPHYRSLLKQVVTHYRSYLQRVHQPQLDRQTGQNETILQQAKSTLALFAQSRLLCAVREGDFGVMGFNHKIEQGLIAQGLISAQQELWYPGRPIMVTQNDTNLGLYNGDVGICILDQSDAEDIRLKVYFELPDGSVKGVLPSRVPQHETAYAMTIHKSQGSEFDLTWLVLPAQVSPILTKELIYTGVTRAKKQLVLLADAKVLQQGVSLSTQRSSGLAAKLNMNR